MALLNCALGPSGLLPKQELLIVNSDRSHASSYAQGGGDSGQNRNDRLNDELPFLFIHKYLLSLLIVNC